MDCYRYEGVRADYINTMVKCNKLNKRQAPNARQQCIKKKLLKANRQATVQGYPCQKIAIHYRAVLSTYRPP